MTIDELNDELDARESGWEPMPLKALPAPVRDLATAGAKALSCDPAMIAVPALPVLAAAIGNSYRIRLDSTWSEPAVLWTATIAASGSMKSPAAQLALAPVFKLEREAHERHAEQVRQGVQATRQSYRLSDVTIEAAVAI